MMAELFTALFEVLWFCMVLGVYGVCLHFAWGIIRSMLL
jgi:hypothetical protein